MASFPNQTENLLELSASQRMDLDVSELADGIHQITISTEFWWWTSTAVSTSYYIFEPIYFRVGHSEPSSFSPSQEISAEPTQSISPSPSIPEFPSWTVFPVFALGAVLYMAASRSIRRAQSENR